MVRVLPVKRIFGTAFALICHHGDEWKWKEERICTQFFGDLGASPAEGGGDACYSRRESMPIEKCGAASVSTLQKVAGSVKKRGKSRLLIEEIEFLQFSVKCSASHSEVFGGFCLVAAVDVESSLDIEALGLFDEFF